MKRTRFVVRYPRSRAHPIHGAIMDETPISEMALLMWGPQSTITTLSWYDGEPGAVRDVVRAAESATTTELVAGDGGTYAFLRQEDYGFDDDVLDLVTDAGVVFLPPITFRQSGEATFEAVGEPSLLATFHDALVGHLDTEIARVADFHGAPFGAPVTDRQREAVSAALAVGYYEVPRTGTVADVADELGCASSTAGELLRKAESAIVRAFAQSP